MRSKRDWGTLGEPSGGAAKLLNVIETNYATLRHAHYSSGTIVPLHKHELATLVYGVGGPCTETAGSDQASKRRLTFHPKGFEHSLRYFGPTHVLAIDIHEEFFEGHGWPTHSSPLPATLYDNLWAVLLTASQGSSRAVVDSAITALVLKSVECLGRRPPEWVREVIDVVHSEWRNVASARALAAKFQVSPQHLCRSFKKHTGITLQQYALLLRLDNARGLLWWTGEPIADVALDTGFADQSHLTRILSSHSGSTPSRLRFAGPGFK